MKLRVIGFAAFAAVLGALPGAAQEKAAPLPLWAEGAPGALGSGPDDQPTVAVYLPPTEKAAGAAALVCPGGGYATLAEHEGQPVALWLNSLGIAAAVLSYRRGPRYPHPIPLQDASRAMRVIRGKAAEWGVDPKRVGIVGFSAGGHLAATLCNHFDDGRQAAKDPIERLSCRPDFAVLCYPVISMGNAYGHAPSRRNLIGDNPAPELMELLSQERQVTPFTPPTFLFHTAEDRTVPCQNSLLYAQALRDNGVPVELHLYEKGGHGVGLASGDPVLSSWIQRCADWLRGRGVIR